MKQNAEINRTSLKTAMAVMALLIFQCLLFITAYAGARDGSDTGPGIGLEEELRGVWISYLEWEKLPKDQDGFEAAVDEMFDNVKSWGMNAVFVHVRSHSDAMYPSAYYPWSKFASGTAGKAPGYDPLAYMIESAHDRGLQFHAWLNPYRITGYLMSWEEVPESSPAKQWRNDSDPSNDRRVLNHDGAWYYNPSSQEVRELVIYGAGEIVKNYAVDGIHFDDYFYPELNDASASRCFDLPEYQASGSALSVSDWRRDNVNQLVSGVYEQVKSINPSVVFGISPQGFVNHLRSDQKLFVDIDTWMSEPGYVDYIMPQLYWGFETKTPAGEEAPYAFSNNLNTWIDLKKKGGVKLYLGLAAYRAGTDTKDYNEVSEWLRRDDILKRQVEAGRKSNQVSGYCFYSYSSLLEESARKEVENLLPILK
ncbi:MAG: glycoside hydrolase family 10 protein [Lachnospiraceae bacterium]